MSTQTLKKTEKPAKHHLKATNISNTDGTAFDRKAEEMKIFLSHNPIPEEFLKKK